MNAASILWPENELDTAIQHLFDKYLNKTPTNDNGILLSDECRDFIPHFFVIWENCECKMTARKDFHIPGRALGIRDPRTANHHGPRFPIFAGPALGPRPNNSVRAEPVLVRGSLLGME